MTFTIRTAVPMLLRRAVAFEFGIWRSLYRWILRRPRVAGTNAEAFGYAAAKTPVIWTFIILTAIEIPAVHLLLPWPTARLIALVLGIQGLLWMIGALASLKVHPHVVSPSPNCACTPTTPPPWSPGRRRCGSGRLSRGRGRLSRRTTAGRRRTARSSRSPVGGRDAGR